MMLCVSAKPLPNPRHLRGCMKSVSHQYENEGENEGGDEGGDREGMQPNQNKATYIIEFDW